MNKAKVMKHVFVTAKNEVGMFANVTSIIANAGVNVTGLCAWGEGEKAKFAILTDNNQKAKEVLFAKGLQVIEQEAVGIVLENKVGEARAIADKIKAAGIDLTYVYGTTCACAGSSSGMIVLVSEDNARLAKCLNS